MRKEFPWLNLIGYWTSMVPDIIAVRFSETIGYEDGSYESYDRNDLETPAFLRRAFK